MYNHDSRGHKMNFIQRSIAKKLENAVNTFSAVYLSGARQCGKSTLVRNLFPERESNYITFDSVAIAAAAKHDAESFISGLPEDRLNIIDEIQRVPETYMKFKEDVDGKRLRGKGRALYLFTGSANIFALSQLAEPMVGRMAVMTLYPFSAAEVHAVDRNVSDRNFIERLWDDNLEIKQYERADVVDTIEQATFPEIFLNRDIDRVEWFDGYLTAILQRDAVELAKIRKPELIYQLLVSLASRTGSLLTNENIMKETGLNAVTYEKYKALCSASYMTFEIQPWSKPNNLNKRFLKSKKIYFSDTNFLCYVMRRDLKEVMLNDPSLMGHLFENFVAAEIMKATSTLPGKYYVSHFNPVRGDGKETDFVIEKDNGEAIAIEVKLESSLNERDFKNLELCRDTIGEKFKKGVILYTGENIVPFGDRLGAAPLNYLWES
jgi:predicted AAA+ superfamily ATPase